MLRRKGCLAAVTLAVLGSFSGALAQEAPRPAVVVAPAAVSDVRVGASYTGRVKAIQQVDILARVSGFLEEIGFSDGQLVAAGDVLFTIQDDTYAAAVKQAEGALRAGTAQRDLAQIERDRKKTLVERQAVAQNELDVAQAQLDQAEGQLQQLNAALDQEKLQLSYTSITAPFDGIVGLTRLDSVEVEAQIEAARVLDFQIAYQAGNVAAIPTVHLTLANGTAYPLGGKIDYISAQVGQGTDTVTMRARFDNPDRLLLDGALVRVALEQGDAAMVLSVPQTAVQRDQLGTFVMVVDGDGKVEQRRIAVARSAQGKAVIESGLEEGENVIIEGLNKVRPGVLVDAAPAG
jgi:membrane fusion protein (multidrug efflux system)